VNIGVVYMVYVVASGGKQYVVGVGQKIKVEKLTHKVGDIVELEDLLNGGKVRAKVLTTVKGPKISTLKFQAKTKYMRRLGHRQFHTTLEIIGGDVTKKKISSPQSPPLKTKLTSVKKKRNVQAK
jgi:large subunit ribosomal protein L21